MATKLSVIRRRKIQKGDNEEFDESKSNKDKLKHSDNIVSKGNKKTNRNLQKSKNENKEQCCNKTKQKNGFCERDENEINEEVDSSNTDDSENSLDQHGDTRCEKSFDPKEISDNDRQWMTYGKAKDYVEKHFIIRKNNLDHYNQSDESNSEDMGDESSHERINNYNKPHGGCGCCCADNRAKESNVQRISCCMGEGGRRKAGGRDYESESESSVSYYADDGKDQDKDKNKDKDPKVEKPGKIVSGEEYVKGKDSEPIGRPSDRKDKKKITCNDNTCPYKKKP